MRKVRRYFLLHVAGLTLSQVSPLLGGKGNSVAAPIIWLRLPRSREFLAAETGARLSGYPEAGAGALVKLERLSNLLPAQITPATTCLSIVCSVGTAHFVLWRHPGDPQTQERVDRMLARAREKRPQLGHPYLSRFVRSW